MTETERSIIQKIESNLAEIEKALISAETKNKEEKALITITNAGIYLRTLLKMENINAL